MKQMWGEKKKWDGRMCPCEEKNKVVRSAGDEIDTCTYRALFFIGYVKLHHFIRRIGNDEI